ncbi:hypothetical protein SLS62_005930 [Diatrype stigma]|uniref:BTB domain-containing protein n=1 Tax=Diatrype stigma TaxID=117547 RepID=A0AAN9UQH5_9PEZI
MASIPFQSIVESKMVQFIIGPEQKEFLVYSGAITSLSRPLNRLLTGHMKEALEGRVVWDDIDEGTFVRFLQWAYTGDYTDLDPEIEIQHEPSLSGASVSSVPGQTDETEGPVIEDSDAQLPAEELGTEPKTERPVALTSVEASSLSYMAQLYEEVGCSKCYWSHHPGFDRTECRNCNGIFYLGHCPNCPYKYSNRCMMCDTPVTQEQMAAQFICMSPGPPGRCHLEARKNVKEYEGYSEIFLSHARLYVLADKYDIPRLLDLAIYKLWATLKDFKPYPRHFDDIATLILYAFCAFSEMAEGNKMCDMLVLYSACIFKEFQNARAFKHLVEEAPLFAYGLMRKVSERFC